MSKPTVKPKISIDTKKLCEAFARLNNKLLTTAELARRFSKLANSAPLTKTMLTRFKRFKHDSN